MSPTEFVKILEEKGIQITTRTLLNYETNGLIPKPERRGEGRGRGKTTDYPNHAIYEFMASYQLVNGAEHKINQKLVKQFREKALELEQKSDWTPEKLEKEYAENIREIFGSIFWLQYRDLAKEAIKLDSGAGVQYFVENGKLVKKINRPVNNERVPVGLKW